MSATAQQQEVLRLQMIQLVTNLARTLVDDPEGVRVESLPETNGTMLRLHVAPTDLGKVIGKQGRTARSIRTILAAASMKAQHRFSLDIQQIGGPPGSSIGETDGAVKPASRHSVEMKDDF